MSMHHITVDLGARSYPIYIGAGLIDSLPTLLPELRSDRLLIVSNNTVAPLYLEALRGVMQTRYQVDHVVLPDGECFKDLQHFNDIISHLLKHRHTRHSTLVALGGGVIGDMTGFAAACYQRGIDFVQIPTTLLAQVDSSVGGKTAVNHLAGKNMIGAFHQPRCVVIDINTLQTLPDRELFAGMAEVIKYGLIYDADFFSWLEQHMPSLMLRDAEALSHAIKRSCEIKADIVAEDEHESGIRAILNLGHTFGHAIETGVGYGVWLHGEAVAAGMVAAVRMSAKLGHVPMALEARLVQLLQRLHLPTALPEGFDASQWLDLMAVDKKNTAQRIRLVLLKALGHAYVTADYPDDCLYDVLSHG